MSYEITVNREPEFLRIEISGEVMNGNAVRIKNSVVEVLKSFAVPRVLFDVRNFRGRMSIPDPYSLVKEHLAFVQGYRTALIAEREDGEFLGVYGDTSANRSVHTRVFTDPNEAVQWLTALSEA